MKSGSGSDCCFLVELVPRLVKRVDAIRILGHKWTSIKEDDIVMKLRFMKGTCCVKEAGCG